MHEDGEEEWTRKRVACAGATKADDNAGDMLLRMGRGRDGPVVSGKVQLWRREEGVTEKSEDGGSIGDAVVMRCGSFTGLR